MITAMQDAATLSRLRANKTISPTLDDMQAILRMIRDGDLIHVDAVGALLHERARLGIDLPDGVALVEGVAV